DLYEDTCDGTAYVKEYYCDATKLPYGYDSNVVPCPVGTRCSGGACVPSGSVGQALYLGETEGELGSDVILLILALLAVVAVFVLNIWHFRK
ncbi:hypothetical protein KY319_01295, partial [Candidatus Woesearchaeota archaeon]|nr:hypothetical protein [Candidatus Woesearchaeota archaeon]